MAVFVYEIDGVRIAAYGDVERSRAELWAQEEAFKSDLNQRNHKGVGTDIIKGDPIWDEDSKVTVVEAAPSEISKWKESRDRAREKGTIERHDEEWLAFLVPVTHVLEDDASD